MEAVAKGLANFTTQLAAEALTVDPRENFAGLRGGEWIRGRLAQAAALSHGYIRSAMPWVLYRFRPIAVEQEITLRLPNGIVWMARPDLITDDRGRTMQVHDFKTASWTGQAQDWSDSIQMMVNAFCVQQAYKRPVSNYYVHILEKGSKSKPNSLTHPYFKAGSPPLTEDFWAIDYINGWKRAPVHERMPIEDWIWREVNDWSKYFTVFGPFETQPYKVLQFFAGLDQHEHRFANDLSQIDWTRWAEKSFQGELDRRFPRTFNCYEYNHQCDFYKLCFKQPGWQQPFLNGFVRRIPHHTPEPKGEPVLLPEEIQPVEDEE